MTLVILSIESQISFKKRSLKCQYQRRQKVSGSKNKKCTGNEKLIHWMNDEYGFKF